ncbi:MAG: Cell division protein FtsK [Candidatus Carbobacillus altaicus]|uniref:Cell division protein FtsK n=1 Tax=Candidatus Carbonibacillus altaicus TaxID=2163959 RepID=A0A2R6XZR1_9BACL|nr:MAG: Cell division protein FtsK [Candidatus Carbobacillus altaicus]
MVDDPLFERAVEIVLDQGSASASLLQRRLSIGYARAARLIDMMEEQGIVGPYEGSKPRKVLIDPAQYNRESGSASNA